MALHETFTSNADLAYLLGPARPDFNLGTWFGSVSIWSGPIIGFSGAGNAVVEVPVTGIAGVTAVQAEVFGTRTYDASGLASVNVTMIEWTLPGSATVLARYTFDSPVIFPLSVSRFVGDYRFVDILANGPTPSELFTDYFQNTDTLIGGAAADTMYGGGSGDIIDGGGGADQLAGDDGNDSFIYRTGDAVTGEAINGGNGTDFVLAIGAAVTGDLFQTGGVNISFINLSSVEELHVNGTEVVVNAAQLGGFGFQTIVGRSGFADMLTIGNMSSGNLGTLGLINWDLNNDTIAVVGTAGADNVTGSFGNDIFLGQGGADTFSGGNGDDRFLIQQGDVAPQDSFDGGIGTDVLQVDSAEIFSVQITPVTNLRNLTLNGIETLDIVQGSFAMDGADFAGAIGGTLQAPVNQTTGINTIIGNGTGGTPNVVLLEIHLGNLIGLDLRNTIFQNWNDGFYIDKTVRIVAGTSTRLIYAPNEESWINGSAAAAGIYVFGGSQMDQIYGSQFGDYVVAGGAGDYLIGLNGADAIGGGEGNDSVWGGADGDTLAGNEGADSLFGEDGQDLLLGGADADTLDGGAMDDLLIGGAGADVLIGGAGAGDYAAYHDTNTGLRVDLSNTAMNTGNAAGDTYIGIENLQGSNGSDSLTGDGGNNRLNGLQGDDSLSGNAGSDTLVGNEGVDTLRGGLGADALDGGDGLDWANYMSATAGLRVDLSNAASNTGEAAGDTFVSVENLQGSVHADTLVGDAGDNRIYGYDGNDSIQGNAGNDRMLGYAGDDTLRGGAGADRLDGGDGLDWASYALATAGVRAELANAAVNSGDAAGDVFVSIENLMGTNFNDTLAGDAVDNRLLGYDGNDLILGNGGNDRLLGYDGDDTLRGGEGADTLDGGNGSDWANYTLAATGVRVDLSNAATNTGEATGDRYALIENVQGSALGDTLVGDAGDNRLYSYAGADLVQGNAGNDRILGYEGADTLEGGAGTDTLNGGAGADQFVFNTATGASNVDAVQDFTVVDDTLVLENAIFTALGAGPLAAGAFAIGAAASAAGHRVIYNSATGALLYDADGSNAGAAVLIATLSTGLALTAADVLVV